MRRLKAREKQWIERTAKNGKSFKLVLYNRFFIFLFSAICQLGLFFALVYSLAYNSSNAVGLQVACFIFQIVFILYIINKNDRPSLKLGWLLLILLFPAFGVILYIWGGEGRPTKKMRKRIEKAKAELKAPLNEYRARCANSLKNTQNKAQNSVQDSVQFYLSRHGEYPAYDRGDVQYFSSGESAFAKILEDLERAEKYILLEYFIIAHGKMWEAIFKILLEKARQGVQVRIIYDDFGCVLTLPPHYDRYLENASENIKCLKFNKVVPFLEVRMNNRDHRKMLVIDGKTAWTGGINIADEYIAQKQRFGYWKDACLRVQGNAAAEFTGMFFYLWNAFKKTQEDLNAYLPPLNKENDCENGQENKAENGKDFCVQPYDDCPLDELSVSEMVYVHIIDRAKKNVWFFTPYLILDDHLRLSLCKAALRGVDVRIVTPGIPDKKITYRLTRANYKILLKSGVKIYEYTQGFLHSKNVVCDDECAVVGTINLDYRSLYHHFENAVYFRGCEAVREVKKDFEQAFCVSKPCSGEYPKRRLLGRLFDSVLRVFETLM